MYKLAAFDIDGTLLNSQSKLSKENKEAVLKVKELGVKIILATGKHFLSAQSLYEVFDLKEPQISCNGALIYCPVEKRVIKSNPIPKKEYLKLVDDLELTQIPTMVYTSEGFFTTFSEDEFRDLIKVGENKITYIKDYKTLDNVAKVLCLLPENLVEQEKSLRNLKSEEISVVRTGHYFLEFVAPASNKAEAIKYLADKYNIKREEIIAFGDSENDAEMLKLAGLGVCMGNGSDVAKLNSDVLVSNNDSHGVKEGLYKYVLKE